MAVSRNLPNRGAQRGQGKSGDGSTGGGEFRLALCRRARYL